MAGDLSLFDLHELSQDINIALPFEAERYHAAIRHVHTINFNGHQVTLAVPARVFESGNFVPFLRQHTQTTVSEATAVLCYNTGNPVPGKQKYHICTLITNHRDSILPERKAAVSSATVPFVDLHCTMPALAWCNAS